MIVKRLDKKRQCQYPKSKLRDIGYKGYREKRAEMNRFNPNFCMRPAAYDVQGVELCSRHAGDKLLETYCVDQKA